MSVRRSSTVFAQLAKLPFKRSCAAVTCTATLTPGRIFCQDHWFSLPKWLREAIINTFRDAEWDAHQHAISQAAIISMRRLSRAPNMSWPPPATDHSSIMKGQGYE